MISLCVGNATADVLHKFEVDEKGLYFNKRLEEEIQKRLNHSEKQRLRALDGWKKRKDNQSHGIATALPLENVNIDTNNINKIKEEFKNSEILIENLAKRYNCAPDHIHLRMKHFWLEKSSNFEPNVTLQEVRRHFGNWLKIDLTKNPIHRINQ
jgi:hypothetical protein